MVTIYIAGFISACLLALLATPLVKKLAYRVGAIDVPNFRKVHQTVMPRLGGLAIYISFVVVLGALYPFVDFKQNVVLGLLLGGTVIVLLGALDDKYELGPKVKLLGQTLAAAIVVAFGLKVQFLNVPFGHSYAVIDWLEIPLTILWIVGVTNAVNLIDGLDGLAAGVSAIATGTIMVLALLMGDYAAAALCAILLGSIMGFLFFNFHPAKIFMGDTGALFLGFTLATLSILGFKQATFVSFVVPLFILGVPISDTFFAIVRRLVNRKPLGSADKNHLHHCLRELGLSHRKTVLVIYGVSLLFGSLAIVLSQTSQWVTLVIIAFLLLAIQIVAEMIGIVSKSRKPVLHLLHKLGFRPAGKRID